MTTIEFPVYRDHELIFSQHHKVLGQNVAGWHVRKIGGCMTDTFMPLTTEDAARACVDGMLTAD